MQAEVLTVAGRAADRPADGGERQVYLSVVSEDGKIYNRIAKIKTQRMMLRMLAHGEPRLYLREEMRISKNVIQIRLVVRAQKKIRKSRQKEYTAEKC